MTRQAALRSEAAKNENKALLDKLVKEYNDLARREEELLRHISEEKRQDGKAVLLSGGKLDGNNGSEAHAKDLTRVREESAVYRLAINELSVKVDAEKVQAGRAAREKLKGEYAKRVKAYFEKLQATKEAFEEIQKLNAGLEAQGHGGFSPLAFPGVHFNGWEQRETVFFDILKQRNIQL